MMSPFIDQEERQYQESLARLKEQRRAYWKEKLSAIAKPAVHKPAKPRLTDTPISRRYSRYKESPFGRSQE